MASLLQDDPKHSRCVGVFGLSLYTQERDIRDHFERYGPIEDIQVVYDRQVSMSIIYSGKKSFFDYNK